MFHGSTAHKLRHDGRPEGLMALPPVAAYLDALPAGLDSYPTTLVKASTVGQIIRMLPEEVRNAERTCPLGDMIDEPPPVSSWIPEVHMVALVTALRETAFASDGAFLAWIREGFEAFWGGSMYRVLMTVASPQLLVRGGDKRWKAMWRGSTRRIFETHPNGNFARVDFPRNLVNRIYAEASCVGFGVAYRMSRAPDPEVRIEELTPTYYVTRVLYDRSKPIGG